MGDKVNEFIDGLVITNKTYDFFIDWNKVGSYAGLYKDELALLSVLTASSDPRVELKRLLTQYPKINQLIPLLVAVRDKRVTVIDKELADDIVYDFPASPTDSLIEQSVVFAEKTGLLNELTKMTSHADYYFGVEAGVNTNARKNRSGNAMENLVEPHIAQLVEKHGGRYLTQKKFAFAGKEFGVKVPPDQANKKGDFMILLGGTPINIETNFFDGGGSKQEIVNSYISRKQDLDAAGWKFGLITDGPGWKTGRNQLELAYSRIVNIYNIKMCIEGGLDDLLG